MAMGAIVVIVFGENLYQVVEIVATKCNEVVQDLVLDTLNYSLDSRV